MHPPGQHSVELRLTHKRDFITPAKNHQLSAVAFQPPISSPDIHSMFYSACTSNLSGFSLLIIFLNEDLKD